MDKLTLLTIYFHTQANSFIHMIRKILIFNRIIPVDVYKYKMTKRIFSIIGVIVDICKMCIKKSVMVFLLFYIFAEMMPKYSGKDISKDGMSILFIMCFCVIPYIYQCKVFKTTQDDFMFLHHFMINPTEYYRYKLSVQILSEVMTYVPILVYMYKDNIFIVVTLVLLRLAFLLGTSVFYIVHFEKYQRIPSVKMRMYVSALLAVVVGAFVFALGANIEIDDIVYVVLLLMGLLISVLSAKYILSYKNFRKIAIQYANKNVLSLKISVSTVVEEDEDGFTGYAPEKNEQYYRENKDKDAQSYLNSTLIYRLGKIIKSHYSQNFKLNIVIGCLLGLVIRLGIAPVTSENIMEYSTVLITIVSSMVYGQSFCQLCFRNLDLPLLQGALYKDIGFVLNGLKQRYFYLLKKDVLALCSIMCNVMLILIISGIKVSAFEIFSIVILIAGMLLFYETYHFMVYYFIQPYTADITVSSPVFRVLEVVDSVISFGILFIRSNITHYAFVVLGVAFVLMVIFMGCAKKIIPNTFTLRI